MSGITSLPPDLQQRLLQELKSGEQLVWVAQPNADRAMKSGFKIWFFFLPWTAFSVFWICGASGFKMPSFDSGFGWFPLFGLPFLLIGLGGLCSPLWLKRKALTTIYAITNQRALTIKGKKTFTIKSYLPADLATLEKTVHQDGSGDLILWTEHYHDSDGDKQKRTEGFSDIENVRHVEKLLESLAQSPAAPARSVF
ncbi:MAG: hypothetical protein ACJ8GW_15005 [Massilia sp.]